MIQIDIDMPKCCAKCPCGDAQDGWCYVHNEVLERMENGYPSTETRPEWCPLNEVKHGKWDIEISDDGHQATYRCSECGHQFKWVYDPHFPPVFNYCQKCGADMREKP